MQQRKTLADVGSSKWSQYGEDGIVEAIFAKIGTRSRLCVEIGAWDGYHFSNTANLWTNGWKAVLVECDDEKFAKLLESTKGRDCVCVKEAVSASGPNSIEAILARNGVKDVVDFLSIDIDGDDYHLVESLRTLRPRVFVCEYNPTIPADLDVFAAPGNYFGCSVGALARLARERRYRLAALTDTNAFFVVEEEFSRLDEFETSLEKIRIDRHLVHLVTSYAGDYLVAGRPVFGVGFPYAGEVTGPCSRVAFPPRLLRALRPLRRLFAKIRGR